MKKGINRIISVLLAVCLVFSVCAVGAAAQETTAEQALQTLEKDIPIVEIPGFGEEIYKGLSTPDEADDESIWSLDVSDVLSLVREHLFSLLYALIFRDSQKLNVILTDVFCTVFGDAACDENGVPDPDTGIKADNEIVAKEEYGQRNCYSFVYDWRLDMHTISTQLHEYITEVMRVTGSDKVGLVSFSMGGSVMMTYLYEYYYSASAQDREHINSAVIISGAMNGVACCEDPFSGNIVFDSQSVMYMLKELMGADKNLSVLYSLLDFMYRLGMFEPLISYANDFLVKNLGTIADEGMTASIGTIPGFYALMSYERYYDAENFIFDSAEDREKFAGLIEKNRYYHENVQANSDLIINSFLQDGKNFAVISEYGYSSAPVTADNTRMADGTITTESTSFGATCAPLGGTLGTDYVQTKECACGKNHVSPDRLIDASTCKYPDITWFAKGVRHSCADRYFADMVDLITYSDEQVTVWTYSDMPQFMVNYLDLRLIPFTAVLN